MNFQKIIKRMEKQKYSKEITEISKAVESHES